MKLWDYTVLTVEFAIAGVIGIVGIACCLTFVGIPVGILLLVLAGRIPQGRLKKIFARVDEAERRNRAKRREDRNQEALDNVTAVLDEELSWLI